MVYGLIVKPEHGYYVKVEALDRDLSKIDLESFLPVEYFDLNRRALEARWFLVVCNRPVRLLSSLALSL